MTYKMKNKDLERWLRYCLLTKYLKNLALVNLTYIR